MAIARDTDANLPSGGGSSSETYSYTVTGDNPALIVAFTAATTDIVTSVTFNGVAMTQLQKIQNGASRWSYLYYLTGQSGTHNVVITASGTMDFCGGCTASYTGVTQGVANASGTDTVTGNTTLAGTLTTLADNSWVVDYFYTTGANIAASTGATFIATLSDNIALSDSNGLITPAGANSQTVTWTGSANAVALEVAMAPAQSYALTQSITLASASTDYLTAVDSSTTSPTGNFTLEMWVNFTTLPGSGDLQMLMSKYDNSNRAWWWAMENSGGTYRLKFSTRSSDGGADSEKVANWTPSTGVWYFIRVTHTDAAVLFYVDGVEKTSTGTAGATWDAGGPFTIGRMALDGGLFYLNAKVSLARVWAEVHTTDDGCTVYGTATTNMNAEWTLDNTLNDASGNNNTLSNPSSASFGADVPAICSAGAGGEDRRDLTLLGVS